MLRKGSKPQNAKITQNKKPNSSFHRSLRHHRRLRQDPATVGQQPPPQVMAGHVFAFQTFLSRFQPFRIPPELIQHIQIHTKWIIIISKAMYNIYKHNRAQKNHHLCINPPNGSKPFYISNVVLSKQQPFQPFQILCINILIHIMIVHTHL